jgi:hypothetical protein
MTPPPLPACRHRGEQLLPDRWLCFSSRLVLRNGLVSGETCRSRCPYVDHEPDATDPAWSDAPTVAVDDDPGLIAVGVITAPRPVCTLPQTVSELRRGGFTRPVHVFAEPGSPVPNDAGLVVRRNPTRLGLWGNWREAARRLLADTDAPFLLICEDDVRFAPCAALGLQHAIATLPHDTWGYASLYTPRHNLPDWHGRSGWQEVMVGVGTWGALAWCFTRPSLRAVLESRAVRSHAAHNGTDAVVSLAVKELRRKCYFHVPSLGDHTGEDISTQGHVHGGGQALGVGFSHAYRGYLPRRTSSGPLPARIPRVIHQVWIGPLPPPVEWLRTWAERHSGWEYRLWTEHTAPFPLRNQAQFDAAPDYWGKADVLRYEVLLRHGGIYVDADMRCLRPFGEDDLRHTFLSVYEDEERQPGIINNCLIGCEPGSPLMEDVVASVGRLSPEDLAETPAWVCTGPALLTRCVNRHRPAGEVRIFPSAEFIPVHFQAGAVDRDRLAGARAVHYFQSSPASDEFSAFKSQHLTGTGSPAVRPDELTVVVQTSFVPAHPDTAMLERSLASLKLLGQRPRFLFLFDGLRGSAEEERRYQWYKRLVRAQFPGECFEAAEWVGSGGCLRRALDRVTTPYLLYWEHDWELNRPIDTAGVLRTLRDQPAVRSVRLNQRVTLQAPGDLELLQRPSEAAVPLVATPCWSANPHFARTETYRSFVLPRCVDGQPLEVPLFEEALRAYRDRGLPRQHADWGNCIYGSIGDAAVVSHLDGRTFVPPAAPSLSRPAEAFPACGCPEESHCECSALHSYRDCYRRLLTIARPRKVLEWGPGLNTRLALEAGAEVISREFDPKWVPDCPHPKHTAELVDWQSSRWTDLGHDRDAELFFIDSRRRSDCLEAVLAQAPAESLVCLHDAQRRRYHAALAWFEHVLFAMPGFAIASRSRLLLRPIARLMELTADPSC